MSIFLSYFDIKEYVPVDEGRYMVFMTNGTVRTSFWDNKTNAFMDDMCRGVYLPQENIAFWTEIPSNESLKYNLYKEL